MTPFDYVNSINEKRYIFDGDYDKKAYNQYVINMAFSYFPDTILIANEMNMCRISDKAHYDFLYNLIRKGKRFSKWDKSEKDEDIDALCEYYNLRPNEAKNFLPIVDYTQIEHIKKEIKERDKKK